MLVKLLHRCRYRYICHKELQTIKQQYGQGRVDQAKMWMHYFRHRASTGLGHMKTDLFIYYTELRKLQQPTNQQLEDKYRIQQDLKKLGPVIVLNILPFSIVFLAAYIRFFPDALPSWFEVDQNHHDKQRKYHLKRCEAIQKLLEEEYLNIDTFELEKLRLVAESLDGKSVDGTAIISGLLKRPLTVTSFPMKFLSATILKAQIKYHLNNDPRLHHVRHLPAHDKLNYKFNAHRTLLRGGHHQQPNQEHPNN